MVGLVSVWAEVKAKSNVWFVWREVFDSGGCSFPIVKSHFLWSVPLKYKVSVHLFPLQEVPVAFMKRDEPSLNAG